jgi:16S rRNA G527 N7-methylase RsmG
MIYTIAFSALMWILTGMQVARAFAHYSPSSLDEGSGNFFPPIIVLLFWPPFAIACILMYLNKTNEAMIKGYKEEIAEERKQELETYYESLSEEEQAKAGAALRELEELRRGGP